MIQDKNTEKTKIFCLLKLFIAKVKIVLMYAHRKLKNKTKIKFSLITYLLLCKFKRKQFHVYLLKLSQSNFQWLISLIRILVFIKNNNNYKSNFPYKDNKIYPREIAKNY